MCGRPEDLPPYREWLMTPERWPMDLENHFDLL
jgi:hypothetical protein